MSYTKDFGLWFIELFGNPDEVAWMDKANCVGLDTELFFPERGYTPEVGITYQVCEGCSVKEECGLYAMKHNIRQGIWGGMSERQRRVKKRTMKAAS